MNRNEEKNDLKQAMEGDINAFQALFADFQDALKSYLFRLTASRADADDLTHDTFIRAFTKISTFKGNSSLKTWVFQIATNLAYNQLQKKKRWAGDVSEQAKNLVLETPSIAQRIEKTASQSPFGTYEIKEHIDLCFTCIGKSLPIENQIALILKEIYDFSVGRLFPIQVKHKSMCSLIS
ncbi:MAG: sigma-70 family RNA polymerase sigma factor [Bacteroidota bacterium]